MGVKYIGDQGPSGLSLGVTTSDLLSFYGVTPVVQPASALQAAVAATVITTAAITTTTNAYGYATTTQANNIAAIADSCRTLLNQIRTDLIALGLIKGSV